MLNGMGAKDHFFEIKETMQKFYQNLETIGGKRKKYSDYKPATVPTRAAAAEAAQV